METKQTQAKQYVQLSLFTNNIETMTEQELQNIVTMLYKECLKSYSSYRGYRGITDNTIYLNPEQVKNIDFIISAYKKLYTTYKWCWFYRFDYNEAQQTLKVYINRDTE